MMALAAEHQKEGRLEDAEHFYRRVLRQNPRNVDALRLLALIAAGAGREGEAESLLRKAIALAPDYLLAILDLARLLKEQDRYREALECFDRALALDDENDQVHFLRASTLAPAAFTNEAIAAYQKCLQLKPGHVGALLGLGHMFKAVGRYQDAVESYSACIRERPDIGETYWSLANLKTYRFDDATVAEMELRCIAGGGTVQSTVNFLFALAKAYEDRGDYERAWELYQKGNAQQRAEVSYDPVQTEDMNDRLIEVFSADFLESRRSVGEPDPAPIFILGLPRSGSTLLEQIIASHSQVEGTSELPYLGRVTQRLNRAAPRARATRRRCAGYATEVPGAGRGIPGARAHASPPGSAAVHRQDAEQFSARRLPVADPAECADHRCPAPSSDACLSCYRQLFAKGQAFTYDLTEIGEYYLQYQRMMDHWAAVLPGRVLTVQYEEVVADFEKQVRRLLEFCGLGWEAACLKFYESDRPVRTPSAQQVRQPIYDRSVGHWRHYADHLDELVTVIEPIRDRYE